MLETKPDFYYRTPRSEMLAYMPESARTVLEVGCAEGSFGRSLKERGAAEVWGIEIVESAAEQARAVLDRVLVGDAGRIVGDLPDAHFDLVVCNDVLEHMLDPFTFLADVRSKIAPGGVLVSSIPNMRYYYVLRNLVLGKSWEYEESGILDRTHIRFFTTRSIRAMYERLGYEVLRHEGINAMAENPRDLRIANLLLRGRFEDTRFVQFATVARPKR
jgi:2-polyprenyl-3-methyl-5-hydroxy-6-metoxy-1,4-benzoquinol methylase